MTIGFIGAGKAGTALGLYLTENGYNIKGYYSRNCMSAKKAAKHTDSIAFESIKMLAQHSDILFLSVPDDSIKPVCDELARENYISPEQIIIHLSGAHSSEALKSAEQAGCYTYSLHPMLSIANPAEGSSRMSTAMFSIEGSDEKMHILEQLVKRCGNRYIKLDRTQKVLYHAGACAISNYMVTLMDYGFSFFRKLNIEEQEIIELLKPLTASTVENINKLGPRDALTGPISRGDYGTISTHIDEIKKKTPELLELYLILGIKTINISKADDEKKEKIKNILEGYLHEGWKNNC